MKRQWSFLAIVLVAAGSVHAFNILVEGYTLENYAQYSSATNSNRMEFDGSGNLYINHYDDGKIQKIDTAGQVSTLATGLGGLYEMTWGGGTTYGNYLYTSSNAIDDKILKINLTNGNATQFAAMDNPNHGPCAMNIDRTGNYNNQLYVGTASQDRIVSVNTSGGVSTFTTWPGQYGGGVYGLAFDTYGNYDGKMYVANAYASENAAISGLFMINTDGTASRFCNSLAVAILVDFDVAGTYFNHDMFVMARTNFTDTLTLWRVSTAGVAEEFMRNVNSFTFGDDGAMYVSYYDWGTDVVSIARVVPEPATLAFLAAGGLFLKRRRD